MEPFVYTIEIEEKSCLRTSTFMCNRRMGWRYAVKKIPHHLLFSKVSLFQLFVCSDISDCGLSIQSLI